MQKAKLKRPKSLSEIAADHIRSAIIQGEYGLGENLKESALSNKMGISKTPVREALATLKREGLLQSVSGKGTHVFTLTADELKQLFIYRYTLETAALDIAFATDAKTLGERLGVICKEMEAARSTEKFNEYLQLDTDFHATFFIVASNKYLRDGYSSLSAKIATLRTHLSRKPHRVEKSFKEHNDIATSIAQGNLEAARDVLRQQIDRGQDAYDELLTSTS